MKQLSIFLILLLQLPVHNVARGECEGAFGCPDAAQFEELKQALVGYKEALANGESGEAEVLAKRVMELSIVLNGRDSVDSANALTNLAYVQYSQEQYETSRLNLLAAINTIEEIGGSLSADLIRPLHRLGQTELALGDVDGATEQFQRAVHIGHVHNGPQNTEQIESLEAIAEIHSDSGLVREARDIQKSIIAFQERAVGPESEALLPALQHHANWMHELQLYNRERNTYIRMLRIQENHYGQDDPSLIPTLLTIGSSRHEIGYSRLDVRPVPGVFRPDHYMRRAMNIAANQPQPDWELQVHTALAVGDYYITAQRFLGAKSSYKEAWRKLSDDPARLAVRRVALESPKLLTRPDLPEYYEGETPLYEPDATDEFLRGSITAEFDVNRSGKSVNIKLVESQPPGMTKIENRLVRAVRYVVHRPRMEDGLLVDTQQLTYVYEFFYRESGNRN